MTAAELAREVARVTLLSPSDALAFARQVTELGIPPREALEFVQRGGSPVALLVAGDRYGRRFS